MDPYAAAAGLSDTPAPPAASVRPGATFLQMPPSMQAAIERDDATHERTPFTVNGQPIDAVRARAPAADPYAAAAGLAPTAPAAAAPAAPAAPRVGPTTPQGVPVAPGANTAPTPETPSGGILDKAWAATQAGLNTAAGAVGGGAGMVYGTLEAAGENLKRKFTGEAPVDVEQNAMARARQFTPELPKAVQTPLGQEYTEAVGEKLQREGPSIIAIGPELAALGKIVKSGAQTAPQATASGAQTAMEAAFRRARGEPETPPSATPAPAVNAQGVPEFPAAAPAGSATPSAARVQRAQVLKSVGLDTVRESSLNGDALAGSTDAQTAKLDSPAGREMRAQLDTEKAALANHAEGLVRQTGGTQGLDQSASYGRGSSIVAPLDALGDYYQAQTSALYKTAAERGQGVPTSLDTMRKVLGDDSELTNADRVHLRAAVNAYAKQLGMVGEDGSVFSNAQQAETMRQYLKDNWSPQNAGFVKKLTNALDEDVFKAAGEDVYGAARQMWAEKKNTLDNPNGIAKIMDASGPSGINRAVPLEKIPDAVAGMPVQQFSHIVDTLKNSPDEIQPQAAQALSEIKAQFANKVQAIGTSQAGQWNAKGVNQYLQNNAARMAKVFSPDEIAQFRNLNDAGNILAKDQSYPGAAAQTHNLLRSGVVGGLSTAGGATGATIGGTLFGPPGAAAGGAVGSWAGAKAGASLSDAAALRAARKRVVPVGTVLSEVGK